MSLSVLDSFVFSSPEKNIIADSWNKNLNILKDSNSKATPNPIYSGFVQSCSAFSPLSPCLVSFLSKPLCFTQKKIHFPVSSFTPAPNPPLSRHSTSHPHPCRAPLLPVTPRCRKCHVVLYLQYNVLIDCYRSLT